MLGEVMNFEGGVNDERLLVIMGSESFVGDVSACGAVKTDL